MTKLILLKFEDDKDADDFLTGNVAARPKGQEPADDSFYVASEVVGAFKEPTLFCECPPEKRDNSGRSKTGKKFGWWIRSCCGRPAKIGGQRPYNLVDINNGLKPWESKYGLSINPPWWPHKRTKR